MTTPKFQVRSIGRSGSPILPFLTPMTALYTNSNGGTNARGCSSSMTGYVKVAAVCVAVLILYSVSIPKDLDRSGSVSKSQQFLHVPPPDVEWITCPRWDFPSRTTEEEGPVHKAWNKTQVYAKDHGLTFLEVNALIFHKHKLFEIESHGVPGMIVECGVAKAGSAIVLASLKHPERCLHLFDTFEGIPKPSAQKDGPDVLERYNEIQVDKHNCELGLATCDRNYYGNMDDLLSFDEQQFELAGYPSESNAVYFHKGLFDDTVWPNGPVAYAHLDGDWYDSTYHMLERLSPYISEGGYFVLDDVYTWSGATNAFIDYFHVDLEWLKELPTTHRECWTELRMRKTAATETGFITNGAGDQASALTYRIFRIALEVRALAQAVPQDKIVDLQKSILKCKTPR